MGDLRSKLRAKFPRRNSGISPLPSPNTAEPGASGGSGGTTGATGTTGTTGPGTGLGAETAIAPLEPSDQGSSRSHTEAATSPTTTEKAATRADGLKNGAQSTNKRRQRARHLSLTGIPNVDKTDLSLSASGPDSAPTYTYMAGALTATARTSTTDTAAANSPSLICSHSSNLNNSDNGVPTTSKPGHRRASLASKGPNTSSIVADSSTAANPQPSLLPSPSRPLPPVAVPSDADAPKPRGSTDPVRKVGASDDVPASESSDPAIPGTLSVTPVPPSSTHGGPADPNQNSQARAFESCTRTATLSRRQSLLPSRQASLIRRLLISAGSSDEPDSSSIEQPPPLTPNMVTRKIWVKRPGGSPTLITITEDDLVDDVRELILRKYSNSLGRQYDAPDLTLRIVPREENRQDHILGPEEPMARTLDAYYPGGQSVDEALLIDVPVRRTPRPSPRAGPPHEQHLASVSYEDMRPMESSTDYFGPGAIAQIPVTISSSMVNSTSHPISVLNPGQVPQIPSPGGTRTRGYRERFERPRLGRQHASSPTILNVVGAGGHSSHGVQQAPLPRTSRAHSNTSPEQPHTTQGAPPVPPLPTPPAQDVPTSATRAAGTPPAKTSPPRPPPSSRKKKKGPDVQSLSAGILNPGVPPINVLIVEDNIINLRLLEAFVKRLKVRWSTAMNGREAVNKWRMGGFHLVLMDIQLPVMSGLEATREIRRLERLNSIGVLSSSIGQQSDGVPEEPTVLCEQDKLPNRELFKSPVIIVALTASSLQSDRHEALAAGCNDFLTKVSLVMNLPRLYVQCLLT